MVSDVAQDDVLPAPASPWSLRFSPRWEAQYERDHLARNTRSALATGWFALLLNDIFVLGDCTIDPSLLWRAVLARLIIFTPITLACLWATARHRTPGVRENAKLVIITTAGAGALWIVTAFSATGAVIGQLGLMLIMSFGTAILRLRFPYAVATNAILLIEELAFLARDQLLTRGEASTCWGLLLASGLVSLVANYRMERSDRINYRMLLQARTQSAKLETLNAALEESSFRDALTGLANRRRLDAYITGCRPRRRRRPTRSRS